MAASILAQGEVELDRVPDISDVRVMAQILRQIGVQVDFDPLAGRMLLDSSQLKTTRAPEELVRRMNASFDVMGPLLARCGEGEVSMPGGCRLGPRPVNFHIEAFRKLGAEVKVEGGFVKAVWDGDRLAGMAAIGHGVSHLVTVAQLLVMQGATPDNLHRIMFAHPTLDEIIPAAIAAKRTPVSA